MWPVRQNHCPPVTRTVTCHSVSRSWAQCLLPYAFYGCWLLNMVMNVIWLLLWDREYVVFCVCRGGTGQFPDILTSPYCRLMLAALVVLTLIAVSNVGALVFCCAATYRCGLWLKTYHSRDLACLRILVSFRLR